MKSPIFLSTFTVAFCFLNLTANYAQLGILQNAKAKLENRLNQKIDSAINKKIHKIIDEDLSSKSNTRQQEHTNTNSSDSKQQAVDKKNDAFAKQTSLEIANQDTSQQTLESEVTLNGIVYKLNPQVGMCLIEDELTFPADTAQ